ncbi:MAG TPA: hypothetical protein VE972_14720 [Conexibacter sp.]|nr:hypothetical protein [Conexibacter sp.]
MSRRRVLAALTAVLGALALAAPAHAGWGPGAQLVSVDWARLEQADGPSTAVDVSADGRYVVFQTRAANFFADDDPDPPGVIRRGGIFRYDRTTRQLALVADGDLRDEDSGDLVLRGASAPSVSDDGRYVAFATAQRLVPQDVNDNVDVYVRDMAIPLSFDRAGSGAYRLVSARDGGDDPAHYAPRNPPLPSGEPGASVFAGQAISGDGRYVAFRTVETASDLPDHASIDTPGGNVFVRDLVAHRTVLASPTLADDGTGAGGALAPVAISRDGSTVAWVGENAPAQTRMLTGESLDPTLRRYLWRRWDDPGASTRRITGLADPDDPACPPDGQVTNDPQATGPCYGPLTDTEAGFGDIGGIAPALSADGWTVAFVSGAAPRPSSAADPALDAYVTSMRPGVSRKAGTQAITRGTTVANARANADIASVALSADGSRVLLVTARSQFLAPAPPLLGDPRSAPGGDELYLVDRAKHELRRVLLTPDGGDVDGGVDPGAALSPNGRVIAFTASSTNLFRGDANDLSDAFAVAETPDATNARPPAGAGDDPIDDTIGNGGSGRDRQLSLRISGRRDGSLLLRVRVPTAGGLAAVATVRPAATKAQRGRRRPARRVASARARARAAGTLRLTLAVKGRDLRALRHGARLRARVVLTLTPADGSAPRRVVRAATFQLAARDARHHPRRR